MAQNRNVVVVTGASSGIGEATALRMCRQPQWSVAIHGRSALKVEDVAKRCQELTTEPISSVTGDIREERVRQEVIERATALGTVRALVNSAGVGAFGSFVDSDVNLVDELFDINVLAALRMCQLIVPVLSANGGGTIVNIGSDADSIGFDGAVAYCASKSGLLGASRALRLEVGRLGIRVPVISAGRVDTHFNNKRPGMRPGALLADNVAEVVEFAIICAANIDLFEIRLDSLSRWSVSGS